MSDIFRGIFPALATPMTASEEIDYQRLTELVDWLITTGGVQGVIPLGSTGEFYALKAEERQNVTRATIDAAAGRVPVLVGANASSTSDVVDYAVQAEAAGADGLLLAAPYYSLPTDEELVEHFRVVDAAVGIPIMLYNYPGRTGVDLTPELIERLAELPNVQYVKESTGDAARVSEIIRRLGDRMHVFCGCDTLSIDSFLLGAVGWVGGIANLLPKEHVALYQAAACDKDVDRAREIFYRLLPILSLIEGGGKYTQFVKAGCSLVGQDAGPPRRPLQQASAAEISRLESLISELQ